MKCFYHNEKDAVGVCKNCNKGLCLECAVDVGNGIACKETCVEEVSAINKLIRKNKASHNTTQLFAYLYILMGCVLLMKEIKAIQNGYFDISALVVGVSLVSIGGFTLKNSRKAKSQ